MNRLVLLIVLAAILAGCATTETDGQYADYLVAQQRQMVAQKDQKPLVDLTFDGDGKLTGLQVNQPYKPVRIEPYRPVHHPIWRVLQASIPVLGSVAGIYAAGAAFEDVLNAGGGRSTSSTVISGDGSGNTGGRDTAVTFDASQATDQRYDVSQSWTDTDIDRSVRDGSDHSTTTNTDERTTTSTTTTTTTTDDHSDHSVYTDDADSRVDNQTDNRVFYPEP